MDPAWITAALALAAALIGLAGWGLRWAWRILMRTRDFLDDWAGTPAREGVDARPGVMERLKTQERLTAEIRNETRPNGGNSLRDVVHRTAEDVAEIKKDQAAMRERVELFEHQREGRER